MACCAISTWPAAIRRSARGNRRRSRRTSSRSRAQTVAGAAREDGHLRHGLSRRPDGTCVRDYIHVTDLIEAHALLLDHLRKGGESTTLNCAYGQGYSVRQVIDTVKSVSGVDFRVDEGPRRAGDPASITATGEKIRETLGWAPRHDDLREMVRTALEWERYLMTRNR